jgi:hypothetical protein
MGKSKFLAILFFLIQMMVLGFSPISTQDRPITDGIQWLKDNQSSDGCWGEETEPLPVLLLKTTNAANALHYNGKGTIWYKIRSLRV